MSDAPSAARCVVIGCGIVGNSLAHHLTRLGWTDVVLLDKGPLPNPGGSTGHASNFIFLVDHSKEMTQLTVESTRQYREMGVFTECGGVVDSLRARTLMREQGIASGGLTVRPNTEVHGVAVERGRIRRIETSRG